MAEGRTTDHAAPVDLVIPVYRDLAATRRCIASVLQHTGPDEARVILVDDASPEPELAAWVDEQADGERLVTLRNEENLGFAGAVNRAIGYGGGADVVLLNSDCEVPPGWLARLRRCAAREESVATVTPFSNNATICSYPHLCEASALPAGMSLDSLDALFAEGNAGEYCELPTSVGFCVWLARAALEELGALDATAFARGYGEENEFSRRAAAAGWRNLLCADLFVYHAGARSFGEERHELMRRGSSRLAERFPDYAGIVERFIAEDPLRPYRDRVDALRAERPDQVPAILEEQREARDRLQAKAIEALDRAILGEQLGREIDGLREAVADLEARCAAYDARCELYDRRCGEYEHLLAEARGAVAERDQAIAGLEKQFRQLQETLAAVRGELQSVYASRLWRYGSWLRKWIG